jgi:hypothetical protein
MHAVENKEDPVRGCSVSHFLALQMAKTMGWDKVMICEDDCLFTDDTEQRWEQCMNELPDDWNMFVPGCSGGGSVDILSDFPSQFRYYSTNLVNKHIVTGYLTGSHCIVYRKNIYDTVLFHIQQSLDSVEPTHVDHVIYKGINTYYVAVPFFAYTIESQSDIRTNICTLNDMDDYILWAENKLVDRWREGAPVSITPVPTPPESPREPDINGGTSMLGTYYKEIENRKEWESRDRLTNFYKPELLIQPVVLPGIQTRSKTQKQRKSAIVCKLKKFLADVTDACSPEHRVLVVDDMFNYLRTVPWFLKKYTKFSNTCWEKLIEFKDEDAYPTWKLRMHAQMVFPELWANNSF